MARHASRVDRNQPEIVKTFRELGYTWIACHAYAGFGCDGITFPKSGGVAFVEIKDGDLAPSARKLTESEVKLQRLCIQHHVQYWVVKNTEDVVDYAVDDQKSLMRSIGRI